MTELTKFLQHARDSWKWDWHEAWVYLDAWRAELDALEFEGREPNLIYSNVELEEFRNNALEAQQAGREELAQHWLFLVKRIEKKYNQQRQQEAVEEHNAWREKFHANIKNGYYRH